MAEAPDQSFYDLLSRARRGEVHDRDLAKALRGLECLTVIPAPGDMMRFMGDLDRKWKETGRPLRREDARDPTVVGVTTKDGGFVPLVFTSQELAREHAASQELIDPGAAMMLMTSPPDGRLFECLQKGWAGLILDRGCEHELACDVRKVAHLWGYMTWESFARLESIWLLMMHGKPITQNGSDGRGLQAFVYDSQGGADFGAQWIQEHVPGAVAKPHRPIDLFRGLLKLGVTELLVDVRQRWNRTFERDDLVRMVTLLESEATPQAASTEAAAPNPVDPALQPQAPAPVPAPAGPTLPALAPPGRNDAASIEAYEKRDADYRQSQLMAPLIDGLAFDQDVYVPLDPETRDGCTWPMVFKHPTLEGQFICHATTSQKVLADWLAEAPPEFKRIQHLSGVEFLRWMLALAQPPAEFGIDYGFPGRDGSAFSAVLGMAPLFPLWWQHKDPSVFAKVPLARLGALPGARGLTPAALRALVTQWRDLVVVTGANGEAPEPVEQDGSRYLPAFSGPEPFLDYGSRHPDFQAKPRPLGADAPFGTWLRDSLSCDGVVLDPGGAAPLRLDHADLLGLHLHVKHRGGVVRGREVLKGILDLHAEVTLSDRMLGRLVAEWPAWNVCFSGQNQIMVLPMADIDCCPVFTSPEKAQSYIIPHENLGIFKPGHGMEPRQINHGRQRSVFHFVLSQYKDGMWIDPEAMAGGGLHLSGDALLAARDRVDEIVEPRVPGFRG